MSPESVCSRPQVLLERKAFQLPCGSCDQGEGMQAFLEKRKPESLEK